MTLVAARVVQSEPLVGRIRVDSVSQRGIRVADKNRAEEDRRNRYRTYDARAVNSRPLEYTPGRLSYSGVSRMPAAKNNAIHPSA